MIEHVVLETSVPRTMHRAQHCVAGQQASPWTYYIMDCSNPRIALRDLGAKR
jgi:hypothetical protein